MITVKVGQTFEIAEVKEVRSVWVFASLWPVPTIRRATIGERITYRIRKAIAHFREAQAMNRAEARAAVESVGIIERIKEETKS